VFGTDAGSYKHRRTAQVLEFHFEVYRVITKGLLDFNVITALNQGVVL
jgi:hypothetical protein